MNNQKTNILVEPIQALSDNYIWLIRRKDSNSAVIVDPGEAGLVMRVMERKKLTPEAILLTHRHADHTAGAGELRARFPQLTTYGPTDDNISVVTSPLSDKQSVNLVQMGLKFEVIDLPGHTRGHIGYFGQGMLFCGDVLFTGGCGRVFEGTHQQMYSSLQKLAAMPESTLIYCAHEYTLSNLKFALQVEPNSAALQKRIEQTRIKIKARQAAVPSTLKQEKETNPFLRCHLPEVKKAAENFSQMKLSCPGQVFKILRTWKDEQ